MKYGGHQFGHWNPDLGDGRGVLMAEYVDAQQRRWDFHLKGAGPTPFSRRGDGRAVLRSSIREWLAGEAMAGLGVPTTRALMLWRSETQVIRERREPAALLLRIADCHLRFGHVEWLAYSGRSALIPAFLEAVMRRWMPDCLKAEHPIAAWFAEVVQRTARLMADWQVVGFCHGVMNTDNCSLTGHTFDYGPYGFLDTFQPGYICNTTDVQGRYAWYQQPHVGWWNVHALAHALQDHLTSTQRETALAGYEPALTTHYDARMNQRLGLTQVLPEDRQLVQNWLQLLQRQACDYHASFRWLTDSLIAPPYTGAAAPWSRDPEADTWWAAYQARCQQNPSGQADHTLMARSNPRVVLRNAWAQQVIEASERGDDTLLKAYTVALQHPFDLPDDPRWMAVPPPQAACSSLSCSS